MKITKRFYMVNTLTDPYYNGYKEIYFTPCIRISKYYKDKKKGVYIFLSFINIMIGIRLTGGTHND